MVRISRPCVAAATATLAPARFSDASSSASAARRPAVEPSDTIRTSTPTAYPPVSASTAATSASQSASMWRCSVRMFPTETRSATPTPGSTVCDR